MKSATYLIFFALLFIVGNEVYGQISTGQIRCPTICEKCTILTCPSGSYPLLPGSPFACQCCATCVTPEVGDWCYREDHVRSGPLSCGSELKCCTDTNTCQAK